MFKAALRLSAGVVRTWALGTAVLFLVMMNCNLVYMKNAAWCIKAWWFYENCRSYMGIFLLSHRVFVIITLRWKNPWTWVEMKARSSRTLFRFTRWAARSRCIACTDTSQKENYRKPMTRSRNFRWKSAVHSNLFLCTHLLALFRIPPSFHSHNSFFFSWFI